MSGIDVVRRAVGIHTDRHDNRDEAARQQQIDDVGVDTLDVADKTEIGCVGCVDLREVRRENHAPAVDEAAVLAVDPDRLAAVPVDEPDELLVDLAQHHFHDVERRLVGHAHATVLVDRNAHLFQ